MVIVQERSGGDGPSGVWLVGGGVCLRVPCRNSATWHSHLLRLCQWLSDLNMLTETETLPDGSPDQLNVDLSDKLSNAKHVPNAGPHAMQFYV